MCPKVGMQRCFCVVGVCNASLMFMAAMLRTAWKCFCAFPSQISFVELCAEWGLSEAVWLTSRRKGETAWAPKAFRQALVLLPTRHASLVSHDCSDGWGWQFVICCIIIWHHYCNPMIFSQLAYLSVTFFVFFSGFITQYAYADT